MIVMPASAAKSSSSAMSAVSVTGIVTWLDSAEDRVAVTLTGELSAAGFGAAESDTVGAALCPWLPAVEPRRLLMEAIDELPPMFQEVVRLRDREDRPNAEVARRQQISKRNVASRQQRAHHLLRRRFQTQR